MVSVHARDIRRFSVAEYHRAADAGLFEGERVELLEGVIVAMGPQKSPHAVAVGRLTMAFAQAVSARTHTVRVQSPLTLGSRSEPEPDLAVVTNKSIKEAHSRHPDTAVLVVEVSDTTLRIDRSKAALYAVAEIGEYWIVNIQKRCVEVMREPVGSEYKRHHVVTAGVLKCAAMPKLAIDVKSLWQP